MFIFISVNLCQSPFKEVVELKARTCKARVKGSNCHLLKLYVFLK